MATHVLKLDAWHPVRLNRFTDRHWTVRSRLKKADRKRIAMEAAIQGVPKAEGRRRVDLLIVLAKGQRAPDSDAFDKALRDSLVHAGLLTDDNREGLEDGEVAFERTRDASHWTVITLTDVGPAPKIKRLTKGARA